MKNKIDSQTNKWIDSSSEIDTSDLEKFLQNFKIDAVKKNYYHYMYNIIEKYYNEGKKTIEIGGQFGGNLFILNKGFKKTLLDLDNVAIKKAKEIFNKNSIDAEFIVGDMFSMPIEDNSFDIAFNAGVLEHFTKEERISALKEYKRILKKDGMMILAVPNHMSFLYRFYYLFLNFVGQWKIPEEFKITDFHDEVKENKLELVETKIVCPEVIFDNYNNLFGLGTLLNVAHKIIGKSMLPERVTILNGKFGMGNFIRYIHKFYKVEGYLIVFVIKKI